jgi:hypothetical protein
MLQATQGVVTMRRIWPAATPAPDVDSVESRFPPGSRSGEGSESLRMFLEAARKTRVPAVTGQERPAPSWFARLARGTPSKSGQ